MQANQHRTSNIERRTSNGETAGRWDLKEGEGKRRNYDLEDRLLEFASAVIDLSEKLPNTRPGNHIAGQILRSGTSAYPNHGEAESAESPEDFIHKLKICLKELRETRRWARLIDRKRWSKDDPALLFVQRESEELIRIFMSSIQTAKRNALSVRRKTSDNPSGEAG